MQPIYVFSVCVAADTLADAEQVLDERLDHYENYGFPYKITSYALTYIHEPFNDKEEVK